MFSKYTIEGLRGVGTVELRFDEKERVYVLFGTNGVGKTKCLEAIYETLLLSNKIFLNELGRNALSVGWPVMRSVSTEQGNAFTSGANPIHLDGHTRDAPGNPYHELPIVFLGALNRSVISKEPKAVGLVGTFAERRGKYFGEILGALGHGRLSSLGMSDDVQAWFVSRAQSVNPYQKESDNRQVEINAVLEMLNSIDARIDKDVVQIDGGGRVSLSVNGDLRELRELSSGFASLVKLVQAIVSGYANFTNASNLRHVTGIVLIDEIESHLHATWQSRIIPRLKEMLPNTVFYIATHSPLVLMQLQEGEAYLLERMEDGVVRSEVIDSPNKRAFVDVLESALDVNINELKRKAIELDNQANPKKKLLDLLQDKGG